MAPIKVGIIGFGFSANCFHIPFILPNPDLELYAILQRAPAPAPGAAAPGWGHCAVAFPQARHYRTADEFFGDAAVELVVICAHEHAEFIERSLNTGKHVVVEKPFVTTSEEADRLTALAQEKGKVLSVFHNRRFDSDFRTLQHLVHAGALGDVRDAQLHFDFPTPGWIQSWTQKEYQPGEGMAFGLGTHTIDQALCLFGRPASVTGLLRSNRGVESDVDDTFTILLQYGGAQKNLVVTVKTAVVTYMQDQLKFFVRGTKGTYLKFGTCPQEARAIASPGQPAVDPNFGVEDPRIWGTLTTVGPAPFDASAQAPVDATPPIATSVVGGQVFAGRYPSLPGWYRGYYENVADVVRGRRPREELAVQPQTARDGLRVIELARESHRTGRTVPWS